MEVLSRITTLSTSLCLFFTSPAISQETQGKVLAFGIDLSGSMLNNGLPIRHVAIQQAAIEAVFSGEQSHCGDLTVVLFGWSYFVHDGEYTVNLSDPVKDEFLAGVAHLSLPGPSRDTTHLIPYIHAQEIFARWPDHEHYLLVTTDEPGSESALPTYVPDAQVFVVAYTGEAAAYAETDMVDNVWDVLMAVEPEQATNALTIVLQEIIKEVCSGV
jgi:hypothetical protein